jgi:hypothetical protein
MSIIRLQGFFDHTKVQRIILFGYILDMYISHEFIFRFHNVMNYTFVSTVCFTMFKDVSFCVMAVILYIIMCYLV